ncbi:MAG TPA: pyridoxamine 5'-phosphate oxidase family protein [Nocardioides sp.]|uniref:pyridoxamine 5'-phosphate oxidase family protein n=1 Tax=uncultured Nocardioides sp. TaxID=198441 RepID=UPI00263909BF|nr:pyridoxamine 5'-phosphate oxidase family protein [uncultured Nocardioides sp.]HRD61555.1 pyridoxamine 5'-phosphate oxidase family protein [Nocardioides sp.]HRI95106.1 pyridoxamine 5'-phosphate oxidase family protein [Nocardioides sp.]HRK45998.1 pyridoxamine 5'-phosphate oxidase family protein [Nocardioides sp.]
MQAESTPRRLVDLTPDECWALAASRPVGRLAWSGPSGPTVIPVNFVLDGRTVRIRTTAYSAAARECDDSPVAFQIDTFDSDDHTGWSVLIRGHAHLEYGEQALQDAPEPWISGPRTLLLRVEVAEITGRRLD